MAQLARYTQRPSQSSLTGYGIADYGMFEPSDVSGSPSSHVWILSTIVVPQPSRVIGVWLDSPVWERNSVWYK